MAPGLPEEVTGLQLAIASGIESGAYAFCRRKWSLPFLLLECYLNLIRTPWLLANRLLLWKAPLDAKDVQGQVVCGITEAQVQPSAFNTVRDAIVDCSS